MQKKDALPEDGWDVQVEVQQDKNCIFLTTCRASNQSDFSTEKPRKTHQENPSPIQQIEIKITGTQDRDVWREM